MKISKVKNFSHNMIFGLAQRIISLLLPFVIRTVIIRQLGTEYLGISNLFSAILQALSLAELGLGSAMVFNMYKSVASNDYEKLSAYMYFYKKCYRTIGLFILTTGLLLTPFLTKIIHGTYPQDISIHIVYLIYLCNTVLSYWLFAYKNSIALAFQKNDIENRIILYTQTGMYILQIVALFVFKNYYVYVIFIPLATIAKNILVSVLIDKYFPNIKAKGTLSKEENRRVFADVKYLFGHQIAFTVINSADSIVVTAIQGLNSLTIYNNYYYIFNAIMSIMTIYYHSIQAGIGNDIIVNKGNMFCNFKKFRFSSLLVIEMSGACLLTLTQPFMKIWMGESLMYSNYCVVIFVIGFFVTQYRKVITTYKNAAGIWKPDAFKPYIVIVVDLIIDLFLINKMGSVGAMVSTIISMALIAMPWETVVLYKHLFNVKPWEHLLFSVLHVLYYTITLIGLVFITSFIPLQGVWGLVVTLFVTVIYEGFLLVLFNVRREEMKWLIKRIGLLLKSHK